MGGVKSGGAGFARRRGFPLGDGLFGRVLHEHILKLARRRLRQGLHFFLIVIVRMVLGKATLVVLLERLDRTGGVIRVHAKAAQYLSGEIKGRQEGFPLDHAHAQVH